MSKEIELELEKIKNNQYFKFIHMSDNKIYQLAKTIDNYYIQNKITKNERNNYEKQLNEIVIKVNTGIIQIYNKHREDEIEKQRELYRRKQLYLEKSINKNNYFTHIYNKIVNIFKRILFIF
jgi:hypothetical protein